MLKTLTKMLQKTSAQPVVGTPEAAARPVRPPLETIEVAQDAFRAFPADPKPLVDAVVAFVNAKLRDEDYRIEELPLAARQLYHCNFYANEVRRAGHARFVGSCGPALQQIVPDMLAALRQSKADAFLDIAQRMADWCVTHPEETRQLTGFDDADVTELSDLDAPFRELDAELSLEVCLAAWIAGHAALEVLSNPAPAQPVADDDDEDSHPVVAPATPGGYADLKARLGAPRTLAISAAIGALPHADPIVSVGEAVEKDVGGERLKCVPVRTIAGQKWVHVSRQGATVYEYLDRENHHLPSNLAETRPSDIARLKAPSVGRHVAGVSLEKIGMASLMCRKLHAAAALDLLLGRLPNRPALDALTIEAAGPDTSGRMGVVISLSLNRGTLLLRAVISQDEAFLLDVPDDQELASARPDEVLAHERSNRASLAA